MKEVALFTLVDKTRVEALETYEDLRAEQLLHQANMLLHPTNIWIHRRRDSHHRIKKSFLDNESESEVDSHPLFILT